MRKVGDLKKKYQYNYEYVDGIRRRSSWVAASTALGRPLPDKAVVHHVNYDESDDTNLNLVICENQAYHILVHARTEVVRLGFDPNTHRICSRCYLCIKKFMFSKDIQAYDGLCRICRQCDTERTRIYRQGVRQKNKERNSG